MACFKFEKWGSISRELSEVCSKYIKCRNIKKQACGSKKPMDKKKGGVRWSKHSEGVECWWSKTYQETQEGYGHTLEQIAARKNWRCGQEDKRSKKKVMEKGKAPVLWTIKWEEVDKNGWKHTGLTRGTKATQRCKWQQKRTRNDEVMAHNVKQCS